MFSDKDCQTGNKLAQTGVVMWTGEGEARFYIFYIFYILYIFYISYIFYIFCIFYKVDSGPDCHATNRCSHVDRGRGGSLPAMADGPLSGISFKVRDWIQKVGPIFPKTNHGLNLAT